MINFLLLILSSLFHPSGHGQCWRARVVISMFITQRQAVAFRGRQQNGNKTRQRNKNKTKKKKSGHPISPVSRPARGTACLRLDLRQGAYLGTGLRDPALPHPCLTPIIVSTPPHSRPLHENSKMNSSSSLHENSNMNSSSSLPTFSFCQ